MVVIKTSHHTNRLPRQCSVVCELPPALIPSGQTTAHAVSSQRGVRPLASEAGSPQRAWITPAMQRSCRRPWRSCQLPQRWRGRGCVWVEVACTCACVCVCTLISAPGLSTHTSQLGERLRAQLRTRCYVLPHCTSQEFVVGKGLATPPGPGDLPFV